MLPFMFLQKIRLVLTRVLKSFKRNLINLGVAPAIDIDVLKNACIGAGVCNPVTVTENKSSKRDLATLDLAPAVDIDLLENACVGAGVCNPVTVTKNN